MAGSDIGRSFDDTSEPIGILSTQQLRALAQTHLVEIDKEINSEVQQHSMAERDIQKYMKVRRKDRSKSPSDTTLATLSSEVAKGPKLRSAQDVLDRLRWDPSIHISEYTIGYLERFEGMKEMPASKWVRESTDEEFIPQHRIKFIKRKGADADEELVWHRESKIDKIFGSGMEPRTDDAIDGEGVTIT